jgi:hypothetical protein
MLSRTLSTGRSRGSRRLLLLVLCSLLAPLWLFPPASAQAAEVCRIGLNVTSGQQLRGQVSITAELSGVQPKTVRFALRGPRTAEYTEHAPPWQLFGWRGWDTRAWPNGAYALHITTLDRAGERCGEHELRLVVANRVPSRPNPNPPADGASLSCEVTLTIQDWQVLQGRANVEARLRLAPGQRVDRVSFQVDGPNDATHTEYGAPWQLGGDAGWDTSYWPDGLYRIRATAFSGKKACGSALVEVTLANGHQRGPRIIAVRGLDAEVVSGRQPITAEVESRRPVASVVFTLRGPRDGTWKEIGAPYTLFGEAGWDTREWPDGEYVLTITASDVDGRRQTTSLPLRLANGDTEAPAPTPTSEPILEPIDPETPERPADLLPPEVLAGMQTFAPEEIPFEAAEVVNPGRGFYDRYIFDGGIQKQPVPLPEPAHDAYVRVYWNELEGPQRGRYNFDAVFRRAGMIAKGNGEGTVPGKKVGFRVVLLESGSWNETNPDGTKSPCCLPQYVKDGGMAQKLSDGRWMPRWDNEEFLANIERVLKDMGAYLRSKPELKQRISFIEIGVYGAWGEWHLHGIASEAPLSVRQRIADAHLKAFYDFQLLAMTDEPVMLEYLMRKTNVTLDDGTVKALKPIGLRRDSHGTTHFWRFSRCQKDTNPVEVGCKSADYPGLWELLKDRWKVAPFVVEYFFNDRFSYDLALSQVRDYHVAMSTNGKPVGAKFCGRSEFQSYCQQPQSLLPIGKSAGYRYVVTEVAYPATVKPGQALNLEAQWLNRGATPTYEDWAVTYQLRRADGRVAWQGISKLNLREVLPPDKYGATPRIHTIADRFALPANLEAGSYQLALQIRDPSGYRQPLLPAVAGVSSDGSLLVGPVVVQ